MKILTNKARKETITMNAELNLAFEVRLVFIKYERANFSSPCTSLFSITLTKS
ncbi:MAG: hypothetical protein HY219_01825 [Candidatus Staskawiczbacteria bacterium]|nr:hypothetical protein [Candidatus Staskawiczbacteria bacterium]